MFYCRNVKQKNQILPLLDFYKEIKTENKYSVYNSFREEVAWI